MQAVSQLKRFSDPEWAAQHHKIQLEYNGQRMTYEDISAGLADATTDTIATVTNPRMEQAQQIIDAALDRSDVQFEADKSVDPLSRILTLATCTTTVSYTHLNENLYRGIVGNVQASAAPSRPHKKRWFLFKG